VPADGLPPTLEACIGRYGLRRFKLKVGGDRRVDLDRLERIREVLDRETRGDYRVTIDGNEQFADVSVLRAFWEDLTAGDGTSALARRVDYVEQPLPRDLALGADTSAGLAAWHGRPRLIVDESDDSLDAVVRAIDAGYDGGAFKSSKGVFKGIGNACRIEQLRQEDPGRTLVYSAEDSSTIGPVGLLADLAVIATLGIDEPERNGHHYLRGLTGLPPRAERETLRHHGDLFSPHADGRAALNIQGGKIDVGSVVAAPFGVGWRCDFEEELESADALVAAISPGAL
jgi:L-alanine-DL-glutamate epimerase-like enolase superfamily enzyme